MKFKDALWIGVIAIASIVLFKSIAPRVPALKPIADRL